LIYTIYKVMGVITKLYQMLWLFGIDDDDTAKMKIIKLIMAKMRTF